MKQISLTNYIKSGKTWIESGHYTDPAVIYERLSDALIAKKINCCSYINGIKRNNNYDGTQTITIYYCNDVKAVYVVPSH